MAVPIPKGTLLNTATVAVGGLIGALIGKALPLELKGLVVAGLGIVTLGIGFKLLLGAKNILIVAAAIALGAIAGFLLGINNGFESFAAWAQGAFGAQGESTFVEVVIGASILYCVGPMTLLGCIQDGLEGKIDLLAIKSTLDGFMALFFAASSPTGILVTALIVLVVQSLITFAASPLRPLTKDSELMGELSATGGAMLVATGLGLLEIKKLPVADYLPALIFAPLLVLIARKLVKSSPEGSVQV